MWGRKYHSALIGGSVEYRKLFFYELKKFRPEKSSLAVISIDATTINNEVNLLQQSDGNG